MKEPGESRAFFCGRWQNPKPAATLNHHTYPSPSSLRRQGPSAVHAVVAITLDQLFAAASYIGTHGTEPAG
ncbi:hypothetical protein EC912_10134 [Luteibacter rhizovicinus]|uniref:Uncharacterized protein n=1 Tax=Luteibacter rhizovicinus TaxID=242606 RepID=A0A4R3YWR2_9GAMM|nr:hypothetical protein EC912_10134 [Luteibacter rhizovicinus]